MIVAIEGVHGVRVSSSVGLGFRLALLQVERDVVLRQRCECNSISEFEDELAKAIQTITAHFLSHRRNLSSDTIVDVASPSQIATIRELAIPQSNPHPLQSAI